MKIAGLQAIKWDDRRMCNVDLSSVVSGHMDYSNKMDVILKAVGIRTMDEIVDDSKLRKSRSELSSAQKLSGKRQRMRHRSKSCGDLHFLQNIPEGTCPSLQRDRSQSLDSALSRSSTSTLLLLNPTGLKTPSSRLSPVITSNPICGNLSNDDESIQSINLIVPGDWE